MSYEINKNHADKLRSNQDVFLTNIMMSEEFCAIKDKYLSDVFMGIYALRGEVDDSEDGRKIAKCAEEISKVFRISVSTATRLLLLPTAPVLHDLRYKPTVRRDGDEIVLRIGPRTTQEDIQSIWKVVKDLQREIGGSGNKTSINPELAFCIHRQYVIKGRKMTDIFDDYLHQRLEGYNHKPTIEYEEDFRKYYKRIVKGL